MATFIPFLVGVGLAKTGGKTTEAAMLYSGAGVYLSNTITAGKIGRLYAAMVAVGSITVAQLLAAYAAGVAGGIGVSYLLFGKDGAKAAVDFYAPGGADLTDLGKELAKAPERIANIVEGNRAVPSNAAGLIPGQSILTEKDHFSMTSRYNPAEGEHARTFQDHDPIFGTRYNPFTGELNTSQ